jgi:class 3 adenylate cyclase
MSDRRQEFESKLQAFIEADGEDARDRVEGDLWEIYGRDCAVFISDLSGFSRLTARYSIIHFLAMIQQCRQLLRPVITEGGGTLVKEAADNIYAIFPSASAAIDASIAMQRRLQKHNAPLHPDEQIGLCVGIGYGKVLVIEGVDFYGHELNLAFKLGEDTAEAGEILVTQGAMEQSGPERYRHERRTITVSGVTIPHASVVYDDRP